MKKAWLVDTLRLIYPTDYGPIPLSPRLAKEELAVIELTRRYCFFAGGPAGGIIGGLPGSTITTGTPSCNFN